MRALFCLRTIPIRRRAPRMKRANHFPKVWPVETYCFFWSKPTTVVQENFSPASPALAYHVCVFRILSNCTVLAFLPGLSEARTVANATPKPTLSPISGFPRTGSIMVR